MSEKTHYVYSTLSSSVDYPVYAQGGGGDVPSIETHIFIYGGANIPDKYMRTPTGAVVTPVTEQELAALRENSVFKLHEAGGFLVVKDKKVDGEKVAADMVGRDKSAPLVDADFEEGKEPIVARADEDDKRSQAPKPPTSSRRA